MQRHLALAGRLRARRLLAVSEGRRVAGLAHHDVALARAGRGPARGYRRRAGDAPGELRDAFDELRTVADVAVARGPRPAPVDVDDHLAELLLRRSPRLAARLRARVYDQLPPTTRS